MLIKLKKFNENVQVEKMQQFIFTANFYIKNRLRSLLAQGK